jgi:hypothetical protein
MKVITAPDGIKAVSFRFNDKMQQFIWIVLFMRSIKAKQATHDFTLI